MEMEAIVQVGDKTRIDATKSFVATGQAITKVEIKPEGSDYLDVTATKYLDWVFDTEADAQDVTVRVTTASGDQSLTKQIQIITAEDDMLWSTDADIRGHEPMIMNYLKEGRASFLDQHRLAQTEILRWLDQQGYVDIFTNRYTKAAFVDHEEVADWSKFTCLRLIYSGISNAVDDIFDKKAKEYKGQEVKARDRAVLRIDMDGDGEIDKSERADIKSCVIVRR